MVEPIFRLIVDLPFLEKGSLYYFEIDTGYVYWYIKEKGEFSEYGLRPGLAGYLWLLKTEGGKYLRRAKRPKKRKRKKSDLIFFGS